MSKYKVGDKVLLEAEVTKIEKDNIPYPYGIRIAKGVEFMFGEEEMISKTYEDGLNDAWELARKIRLDVSVGGYTLSELKEIFDMSEYDVIKTFTPQEALARIEAYEESKAIKVGDVVHHINSDEDAIVVCKCNDGRYKLMFGDFDISTNKVSEFTKTGRHIDISSLLEQIRGE